MIRTRYLSLSLCAALLCTAPIACSKKEADVAGSPNSGLKSLQLLNSLPDHTVGYAVFNTSTEAYKKFRSTPWGDASASKSFEMLRDAAAAQGQPGADQAIKPFLEAIEKSGFFPKSGQPEVLKEGTLFVTLGKEETQIGAALYANGVAGGNLKDKLAPFESACKSQNLTVAPITVQGASGFSVEIPQLAAETGGIVEKLFVAADSEKLALATSQDLVEKRFKDPVGTAVSSLKGTPQYEKATKALMNPDDEILFGYIDVTRVLALIPPSAPAVAVSAAGEKSAGAEDAEMGEMGLNPSPAVAPEFKPEEIPVESVAFSRTMSDTLADSVVVSMNPKTDSQRMMMNALNSPRAKELVKKVPADLTFLLNLDGAVLKSAKDSTLSQMAPEEKEAVGSMVGFVDSIKEIGVGLRNQTGASPFPELLIVAETTNPNELADLLKMQLSGFAGQGGFLSPLQEKDVDGTKVSYSISPFGAGLFLATGKDSLIIASTEQLTKDLLSGAKSSSSTFTKSLSPRSQELMSNDRSILVAYSNFDKMATMVEQTQGSLSMFTGGQQLVDQKQMDQMRAMGSSTLSLQYQDGLLKLNTAYDATAPKK